METQHNKRTAPTIRIQPDGQDGLRLTLSGILNAYTTGRVWREVNHALGRSRPVELKVDASEVSYCDGTGIGLLFELKRTQQKNGGSFEIIGLKE